MTSTVVEEIEDVGHACDNSRMASAIAIAVLLAAACAAPAE